MALKTAQWRRLTATAEGLSRLSRAGAVALGALVLLWPALWSGFPLLYADSMAYLGDGPLVARAVFLHRFSDYYGVRSLWYSLGILPFHWNVTPWPVAGVQSLLVAWVLWLVVRSVAPRHTLSRYLILMVTLSALSSVSWYASFVMPDILGPVLYLSVYLLVFRRGTVSCVERMGLYATTWWCVTAHATHLVLGAALCVLLVVYAAVERREFSSRMAGVGRVAALIALAAGAQLGLHAYLYGKATLTGEPRPYLMARIIADGPGRMYLEKNCDHLKWAICGHLKELSSDTDFFLWDSGGVFEGSSYAEQARIAKEEMPLVLATLRTYPREQFLKSAANFRDQLFAFGAYGFDPSAYTVEQFDHVIPASRASFLKSRQARDALGLDLISEIQFWVILASLAVMGGTIPLLWKRHSRGLAGLGLIVVSMVVLNALLTGVLSVVDDRYECRLIWLLPLMAGLMVVDWVEQRGAAKEETRKAREVAAVVV